MSELLLVEREREKIFIEAALAATVEDQPDRVRAIFLTGPVGRGQAALLQYATGLAQKRVGSPQMGVFGRGFDWPSGGNSPEALRLVLPPAAFVEYDRLAGRLHELEGRVEEMQLALGLAALAGTGEERYRAVQALPPPALHFLIRRLYTTYSPAQLSDQAAAFIKTGLEHLITLNALNLNQLRGFVSEIQAAMSPADWQLYLRPDEEEAVGLGQGLAGLGPLLIEIGQYVLPVGSSDRWLRRVIEASGPTLWLLGAPQSPGWKESWTATMELSSLTPAGIRTYSKTKHGRALTDEETDWLSGLTGGEPLATAIALSLWEAGELPATLDAARARTPLDPLDGLFLHFAEESTLLTEAERYALYCQAVLRTGEVAFLSDFRSAAQEAGYEYHLQSWTTVVTRFDWLNDGEVGLQPALKGRLREYLLVERRRFSKLVQEGIIEPARNVAVHRLNGRESELVAEAAQGSLAARAQDAAWGERVADLAYYRFWLDEAMGWFFLLPRWLMALAYHEGLARQLMALAESISSTFLVEGQEILPYMRVLLASTYAGGRARLDEKFKALEGLEELGTSGRGRWYRAENLGQRPQSGGSPEAELRGLLKWFQARLLEEAGQYERTAPLYESVLATNVQMPELEHSAGRAALYLATRYRLKGATESAYSALSRATELAPTQPLSWLALFYQSLRTGYFNTALRAGEVLSDVETTAPQGELFTIVALVGLERLPEAQTELRSWLARPADQTNPLRPTLRSLLALADLNTSSPELAQILESVENHS